MVALLGIPTRICPVTYVDSLLAVLALAVLHILCGRFQIIHTDRHSNWLSFAGGVAVAYVFMGLLPKLSDWQGKLVKQSQVEPVVPRICEVLGIVKWCGGLGKFITYEIFLCALAGLVFFFWVDWYVHPENRPGQEEGSGQPHAGLFGLHVGIFAAYNLLIGYILVHHNLPGKLVLVLLVIAIGLHFLGINHSLWLSYREKFDHFGRWIFSASLFTGWLLGVLTKFAQTIYIGMHSFLAGAIMVNVFNEELPKRHEARFWPFLLGVIIYTLILMSVYAVIKH